jgi:hypothetical protein
VGVEPGVSTFSREAMTLAIYGDDVLLAGDVANGIFGGCASGVAVSIALTN